LHTLPLANESVKRSGLQVRSAPNRDCDLPDLASYSITSDGARNQIGGTSMPAP